MILNVENVTKTYNQASGNVDVLRGVDFKVEQPQAIAILGQTGSGKSTLLSLLAGLDRPTAGSISLHGHNLADFSESKLAKFRAQHLGIVFQQFHLMTTLTALENVMLPLEIIRHPGPKEAAMAALEQVKLGHRLNHFPAQLSGGESQRVAIARALVVKPLVMLADEPSGNLDERTGEQVMQLLFDLAQQNSTTLILVTHNRDLAARCQRWLQLHDGRLEILKDLN